MFTFVVVRPQLSTLTATCFAIDGYQIPGDVGIPTFKGISCGPNSTLALEMKCWMKLSDQENFFA